MATYIRNDSLDNFNAAMQNLAAISQRARALNLEEEQMYNRQGVNTSGWQAKGVFNNLNRADIPLRERQQELYGGVDAEQGGILSQVKQNYTDSRGRFDKAGYDRQLQMMGLQAAGASAADTLNYEPNKRSTAEIKKVTDPIYNKQLAAYKEADKVNTPIRKANAAIDSYNAKAEAANRNKPKFRSVYEGDEYDQQNQLLEDAYNAINSSTNINDKIRAYNTYYTAGKSISDHYQHRFEAESPAFFGISAGGSDKGSGGSSDRYTIKLNNGQQVSVGLPKGKTPDDVPGMVRQKLKLTDKQGWQPGAWNPLSSDTTYMNPNEEIDYKQKQAVLREAELAKAKEIKNETASIFSGNKTDIDNANKALAARGSRIRYDYEGNPYYTDEAKTASVESKEEEKKIKPSYKSKLGW